MKSLNKIELRKDLNESDLNKNEYILNMLVQYEDIIMFIFMNYVHFLTVSGKIL